MDKKDVSRSHGDSLYVDSDLIAARLYMLERKLAIPIGFLHGNFLARL